MKQSKETAKLLKNGSSATDEVKYEFLRLTEVKSTWNIEDSDSGEGIIEAEAKLLNSLIELKLRWRGAHEQPEIWEIVSWHHADFILNELPEYLSKFCPVPNEMTEVLRSLGLERFGTEDEV
jgi:hypothetical protein